MPRTTRNITASFAAFMIAGAAGASTPGYVEDFVGLGNVGGFGGGSHNYENPGTGGVGGAGDGYLLVTNDFAANFGAAEFDGNFNGDWIANGVTGISFWLNDVGAEDGFEIHFGVGVPLVNFWQFNAGFVPLSDAWTEFTIDLTNLDESEWTQIIGIGSLEDALSNVERILFRHDTAPFGQDPATIAGDLGIDRIRLVPAPGAAALLGVCAVLGARRKR